MKRRSVLAASGTILCGISAGCSEETSGSDSNEYAYGAYNYFEKTINFSIKILDSHGGSIHEKEIELGPESAIEEDTENEITFEGHPVRIHIITKSDDVNLPWPASSTEPGKISRKIEVTYNINQKQEIMVYG